MANETARAESAAPEFSLGDELGEMFGDISDVETPDSGEGTTPTPEADKSVATAEGTDKEVRAETPSADATKTDPDKKEPEPPASEEDYLKDAKPFTYKTSTGEEKSIEGIRVLGDSGAIVTPEGLVFINERIADAERFHTTSREQYAQIQNFEKLSEFHTKDAEGKDQVLSGTEGLLTARVQLATLSAAYETLATAMRDPATLASLLQQNEKGELVLNDREFNHLITRSDLAEKNAETLARNHFMSVVKGAGTPKAESATQVDYTKEAPSMIDRIAGADSKLLSDADKKFLGEQFPRYVRTVTAADRAQDVNLKIGQPIVDAAFAAVVKDRVGIRSELAKTVKATTAASDANATRLAAAALGQRKATPAAPVTRKPEGDTRADDAALAWQQRERAGAAFLR